MLNENENDDENEKHGFLQIAMLLLGGGAECPLNHKPSTFYSHAESTEITEGASLRPRLSASPSVL